MKASRPILLFVAGVFFLISPAKSQQSEYFDEILKTYAQCEVFQGEPLKVDGKMSLTHATMGFTLQKSLSGAFSYVVNGLYAWEAAKNRSGVNHFYAKGYLDPDDQLRDKDFQWAETAELSLSIIDRRRCSAGSTCYKTENRALFDLDKGRLTLAVRQKSYWWSPWRTQLFAVMNCQMDLDTN